MMKKLREIGKLKRRYLVGLLVGTLLLGTVFGAFVVIYIWETTMTMKLMGDYSIELQFRNGTAISAYDWGLFSVGQTKTLLCQAVNVGDVPVNMTWSTDLNLTAWSLTIDYTNATGQYIWAPGASWGPFSPGGGVPLNMNLTETDAIVGLADSFKLNFTSGEP